MEAAFKKTRQSTEHWKHVLQDIALKSQLHKSEGTVKNYDYSVALPPKLRNRVKKILHYEYDKFDKNAYVEESEDEEPVDLPPGLTDDFGPEEKFIRKKKTTFNESTCSEVLQLEKSFPKFEMKMDKRADHQTLRQPKNYNWCTRYVSKPRKERVKWDTKVYQMETNIWEKTLDEQAEDLMEATAERFTKWINSLGSKHETDLTKDQLKNLFAIEGDRRLLSAIQTEPKELKAITKTVADKWNLPEMAIELKYENYQKERLKKVPKKIVRVAFGRTVPVKERPWVPADNDDNIDTCLPEEILSGEMLFKGMLHLRSVRALVEHMQEHPEVGRPTYLQKMGVFKQKKQQKANQDISLYEKLKLSY